MFGGESVTLVNRTKTPKTVTFDGRHYQIKPGRNENFPKVLVKFAMDQNRVMGTEDPTNPKNYVSLVGVEGLHEIDPIEQSDAVERFDRSRMVGQGKKGKKIAGDPVSAFEARVASDEEGGEGAIDGLAAAVPDMG